MFELRGLAEWAATWARQGPLSVADVACGGCGKAGVRLVKEGEAVDEGPVYCAACRPAEDGATGPEADPLPFVAPAVPAQGQLAPTPSPTACAPFATRTT